LALNALNSFSFSFNRLWRLRNSSSVGTAGVAAATLVSGVALPTVGCTGLARCRGADAGDLCRSAALDRRLAVEEDLIRRGGGSGTLSGAGLGTTATGKPLSEDDVGRLERFRGDGLDDDGLEERGGVL